MFAIHKREIAIWDYQGQSIVGLKKIVSFAVQRDKLVMYFIRDLETEQRETIEIIILGTGKAFTEVSLAAFKFAGTYNTYGGELMWHVFVKENNLMDRITS